MFTFKLFAFAVLLGSVTCLPAYVYQPIQAERYIEDSASILQDDLEDRLSEPELLRVRRQLHGSMSTNPDGSANLNAKLPLAGDGNNMISALGSVSGVRSGPPVLGTNPPNYGSVAGGLVLENRNGHSLMGIAKHTPTGDALTGAAKVNLFQNDNHRLDANAFITRNTPNIPNVNIPSFNTHGGSVDYLFKDKVGASLGMAQTDFLKRTDYSAMGNLNLFKDRSSSLDLNAGFSKSISPYIPSSRWEPSGGLTFTKYW